MIPNNTARRSGVLSSPEPWRCHAPWNWFWWLWDRERCGQHGRRLAWEPVGVLRPWLSSPSRRSRAAPAPAPSPYHVAPPHVEEVSVHHSAVAAALLRHAERLRVRHPPSGPSQLRAGSHARTEREEGPDWRRRNRETCASARPQPGTRVCWLPANTGAPRIH